MMENTIKNEYVNSGNIKSLYLILTNWIEINKRFLEHFEYKDSPWWYNERATLSSLAAATWLSGGIALEEYSTVKKYNEEKSWSGRCDLYIGTPSKIGFACEAKQAWCPIGKKAENGIVNAEKALNVACNDAKKLDGDEGSPLGICFAVPYLPSRDENIIEEQLSNWLQLIEKIDHSSIAWIFPERARFSIESKNNYYHPGVVLLIREL